MSSKLEQLFDNPPERFKSLVGMWQWSYNCEAPTPSAIFLDLVGWSEETLGDSLALGKPGWDAGSLGAVELSYLGDALSEYADRPTDARTLVWELLDAEREVDDE